MSTIEPEDQEGTGYFLPEDSQLRLKQLRDYVGFLANLARPRQTDESAEWYAEIRPGEVAICLELLEEQIGQVLKAVAWPAERSEDEQVDSDAADTDDADAEDGADVAAAESEAEAPDTAEPGEATKRYIAGITLEQIDDINLLLASLHAIGNVVACTDHAELADSTLSSMGDAIYREVDALREIMKEIDGNRLEPPLVAPTGVREAEASYLARPTYAPPGRTLSIVREHPTYQ